MDSYGRQARNILITMAIIVIAIVTTTLIVAPQGPGPQQDNVQTTEQLFDYSDNYN
ncbi:GH19180 [Drosophila grimshawi]|uniref:GH19180 n=1 Tax=Drosophila grimshawi TaxID=7222 RepID=B4JET5_DROGR|nr:GH19180 [Drosophila grimshawi]